MIFSFFSMFVNSYEMRHSIPNTWFYPNVRFQSAVDQSNRNRRASLIQPSVVERKTVVNNFFFRGDPREFLG
jgi:hypothetical protein